MASSRSVGSLAPAVPAKEIAVIHVVSDIGVTPDFNGLPPSVYHGLVHLTNNAAAVLTLVAGLGLVVSLTGLVLASFTANRELAERAKSVREEPGCLQFEAFRSMSRPEQYALIELWESQEVLDRRNQARGGGVPRH